MGSDERKDHPMTEYPRVFWIASSPAFESSRAGPTDATWGHAALPGGWWQSRLDEQCSWMCKMWYIVDCECGIVEMLHSMNHIFSNYYDQTHVLYFDVSTFSKSFLIAGVSHSCTKIGARHHHRYRRQAGRHLGVAASQLARVGYKFNCCSWAPAIPHHSQSFEGKQQQTFFSIVFHK